MRKALLPFIFISSSLLVSAANSAENNMRPGLWKMTTTSDLLKLASQIPPDQMQSLMNLARQNGFDMPEIQNGAATSKVCITQEMVDQKNLPGFYQTQSGCAVKDVTRIGNKYRLDFVCTNSQLNGTGTAEAIFTSAEHFSGRTEFDGIAQGNSVSEHADTSGQWLGAHCGAVKPPQ